MAATNVGENDTKKTIVFTTVNGNGDFQFKRTIHAQYIKFKILEWHKHISMRCDVYIDNVLKDFPDCNICRFVLQILN